MTTLERKWFEAIARDREEDARTLNKPSMRGIWRTIIDKYSDQAHFVYELLQNADDAGATEVEFNLQEGILLFKHNGTERFTVTPLESEEEDFSEGRIGDLNAITGAGGFSTKMLENTKGNVIGKFGVGFKAVFQYTLAPEIYDDNMAFRLENYIVPRIIDADHEWRSKGETLFVFPLNRPGIKNPELEIWKKLNSLLFPTLFLNNLKVVRFAKGSEHGCYSVSSKEISVLNNGITVKKIKAAKETVNESDVSKIWLMTRVGADGTRCSVGYAVDPSGKLKPVDFKAFCYFPTKHETKLNFIIHAPFLLTDSREGIKANEEHNKLMLEELADIAVEGLKFLCRHSEETGKRIVTDDVVKVIPIGLKDYGDGISFDEFREQFESSFFVDRVIPTVDAYVDREHAFWPESIHVPRLFSDDQLQTLYKRKGIRWAFPKIPQENQYRNVGKGMGGEVFAFIRECTSELVQDNALIERLTPSFIEAQPMDWLLELYKWIATNEDRARKARSVPIFLDQDGKACAAYNEKGGEVLFLPLEGETRYHTVHPDILGSAEGMRLVKKYELKEPDKSDLIWMLLDEKILSAKGKTLDRLLKQIFEYCFTCGRSERDKVVARLRSVGRFKCKQFESAAPQWLKLKSNIAETLGNFGYSVRGWDALQDDKCWIDLSEDTANCQESYENEYKPIDELYFDSPDLRLYFGKEKHVFYLDEDHYHKLVEEKYQNDIHDLFVELGIALVPRLMTFVYFGPLVRSLCNHFHLEKSTGKALCVERRIQGLGSILKRIQDDFDKKSKRDASILSWRLLAQVVGLVLRSGYTWNSEDSRLLSCFNGTYYYYYRTHKHQNYEGQDLLALKTFKWLLTSNGKFVSPQNATRDILIPEYRRVQHFDLICKLLKIPECSLLANETADEKRARESLSENMKKAAELGMLMMSKGVKMEDLNAFLVAREQEELNVEVPAVVGGADVDLEKKNNEEPEIVEDDTPIVRHKPRKGSVLANIELKVSELTKTNVDSASRIGPPPVVEEDEDEITPRTIDFEKRIRDREARQAAEIASLERGQELQTLALNCEKYTLGWFKAMLGLEMLGQEEESSSSHEIQIAFTKIEKEPGTERTYILKRPNRNIPQWIEELSDVPLHMLIAGKERNPRIEAMSVKSFDLKVKFRNGENIDDLQLDRLQEARISVQKPDFLIAALQEGLNLLPFDDAKNLRNDLTEYIEFVFGPPGTGKTTFLARERILNLMRRDSGVKVLVLTPTNKAADVLASRIVSCMGEDSSYKEWLIRFGSSGDEKLERSGVKCGKDVDVGKIERCCLITTIARFPYDRYVPGNAAPERIEEVDWDYVIVDEASMIPAVNIIYLLYRCAKSHFIIAGDPFQIDPIVKSEEWKTENIYTMVQLEDFVNPKTIPWEYDVVKLTTQFRSIPMIGDLFSKYRYGGILKHERSDSSCVKLRIEGIGVVNPLTIVKFPVSPYESIYTAKRLKSGANGGSPYQIYSALLTFEFVCMLARKRVGNGRRFSIGVISPYKAQADLVQRLLESVSLPDDVDVTAGTIHGFQGDECDMIVALFNPPPGLAGGRRAFVNRKNIVNVAISRARDYLVLVMPDDMTQNIDNMREVRRIEQLMRSGEKNTHLIVAADLEWQMFKSRSYIEDNSFATGHQSVNVYGSPERKYEIRSEESAVDVQIHTHVDRKNVTDFSGRAVPSAFEVKFFEFMCSKVHPNIIWARSNQYRAALKKFQDLNKPSTPKVVVDGAYNALKKAAASFHALYLEFTRGDVSSPKFGVVMKSVLDQISRQHILSQSSQRSQIIRERKNTRGQIP